MLDKKVKEKRDEIKNYVLNNLFSNYEKRKISFNEFPTGSGKTNLILESAVRLKNEFDTSVIIATSSNELALKFLNEGVEDLEKISKIKLDKNDIALMLGKRNFLDIEAVKTLFDTSNGIFKDYTWDDIENWYNDITNRKLTDLFFRDFEIPETYKTILSLATDVPEEILSINNFAVALEGERKIYVTNQLFLITLIEILSKREDTKEIFKDIPIILDEAHNLKKLAELKYTRSFSTFTFKNLFQLLKTEYIKNGIKFNKYFKELDQDITELFNSTKNLKVHSLTFNDKAYSPIYNLLQVFFEKYDEIFSKSLSKIGKKYDTKDIKRRKAALMVEFNELRSIFYIERKELITFSFSGVKGYLSVKGINKIVKFELRKNFWSNVGNVMLLSGSFRVEANHTNAQQNRWSMERLGLLPYKEKSVGLTKYQSQFNRRIYEDTSFKCFPWIFNRQNFKYTIIEDENLQPQKYNNKKDIEEYGNSLTKWAKEVSLFYSFYNKKHFNKGNTLILVGSYENVNLLAKELENSGIDKDNIFCESKEIGQHILLKKYSKKALFSNGNILIGTLALYTGIDLKGNLCHNIIMTKLPYAPFNKFEIINRIYDNAFKNSNRKDYEKEMRLVFRQGIGRGSRSETDRVALFILDKKIKSPMKAPLIDFLEEMGSSFDFENDFMSIFGNYQKGEK